MNGPGSTFFIVACIFVGAMCLVGLGTLFARAENIERPNLVALCTLLASVIAGVLLWFAARHGTDVSIGVSFGAMLVSALGFLVGRVWDAGLGPRDIVHHDNATLDADLAD